MRIAITGSGNVGKALARSGVKAGPLVMARAFEGMALLNVMLQVRHSWPWQNGWKLVGPPEG